MVAIAISLMVAVPLTFALVVLAMVAFDVRAGLLALREIRDMLARMLDGSGPAYVVPRYPPMRPGDGLALARSHEEQRARGAVDESFGKLRPVEVTRDSESTIVSHVDPLARAEHRTRMEVPVYRGPMPALGEDEERGPGWEEQSGTWTREGR